MANIYKLKPILLELEGGYVHHSLDKGGDTNMGITLKTYRYYYGSYKTAEHLKNITDKQWEHIMRVGYWNPCCGDKIENQSIANIFVDFAFNSGAGTAIRKIQRLFGLNPDGVVGAKTLAALNGGNKEAVFNAIKECRLKYVEAIVENNHSQIVFLRGWQNRINSFKYDKV